MTRIKFYLIIAFVMGFLSSSVYAAGSSGLNYTTYYGGGAGPSISNLTQITSGVTPTVDFNWGGGAVLDSGRSDGVIVRFTGYLKADVTGTYNFGIQSDDGGTLTMDGVSIVNCWCDQGPTFRSGSINLTAGQVVSVEMWYYENGGGAVMQFWMYTANGWQIVPTSMLATDATYWAPVAPSPVYSSSITPAQQLRKTSNLAANPGGHNAVVEITGDDNLISIQQIGGNGHYASVSVNGSVNSIDILQTTTGNDRHYLEASIIGGNNNLILKQEGSAKTQFTSVDGNYNNINAQQRGTGNHYLDLKVTGNNHTAGILQDGAGNHKATVELSGTQPWNFNLTQSGNSSQTYSLPHSLSNGGTVSGACYTVGGCTLTVNQQ